jgi:hypothetical protein
MVGQLSLGERPIVCVEGGGYDGSIHERNEDGLSTHWSPQISVLWW